MLEEILKQFALLDHGYYKFLYENGRAWQSQPLPSGFRRGKPKLCYETAAKLALEDPSLIYVEGVAINLIPTGHAWVVKPDGRVIDPTWKNPENCQYYGLAFQTGFLKKTVLKQKYWGLVGDTLTLARMEKLLTGLHPDFSPESLWLPEQSAA